MLSIILRLLYLITFAFITYIALIYVYKQFQTNSSISCSLNFSNQDCYQKLIQKIHIQKIHKAKHFILIQPPNMLKGKGGKNVINALEDAKNRKISIKYILDKNLIKYHFPLLDNEARFWIDTKPKSYEEVKNQIIYINGIKKSGMIYSILFD
ncbi:MAG: hypothetical protein E6K54_08570 [Gammaproteobacteria bacterium]|nr:MAG: hypothetical protein E6K54_08570 [Gammaproteobacteria bacterium]